MNKTLKLCLILTFIGMLIVCNESEARPYKIAVIDSGFRHIAFNTAGFKLCSGGHYDFIKHTKTVGLDKVGHGAYVTGIINDYADTNNICFLIYKVFESKYGDLNHINQALIKAYRAGAKAINMSLSTSEPDKRNKKLLKGLLKRGIKIFVSAGNETYNLNKECRTYPSCYKSLSHKLIIVGATNMYGDLAKYSNYGAKLDVYEFGDTPQGHRGTSFASPRALGKYIKSLKLDKK